jgi:hypothetical protein
MNEYSTCFECDHYQYEHDDADPQECMKCNDCIGFCVDPYEDYDEFFDDDPDSW